VNADTMSLLMHFTDEVWMFGSLFSNNKEGRSDVTIPKTFQDQRSRRWIRTIVEGQHDPSQFRGAVSDDLEKRTSVQIQD
jgi:hypothetical protein